MSTTTGHQLSYNTESSDLIISEYGRHIQKLAKYACTIEDRNKRQQTAEAIIKLMNQMNPQKGTEDYYNKLWKHLIRIADYKLDVDLPEGVDPSPVNLQSLDVSLAYPEENKRFRHYGRFVQQLIEKAVQMEDKAKKEEFIYHIGSFMKQSYANSGQDRDISDEMIIADLKALSAGKLDLPKDQTFGQVVLRTKRNYNNNGGKKKGGRNQNRKKK